MLEDCPEGIKCSQHIGSTNLLESSASAGTCKPQCGQVHKATSIGGAGISVKNIVWEKSTTVAEQLRLWSMQDRFERSVPVTNTWTRVARLYCDIGYQRNRCRASRFLSCYHTALQVLDDLLKF